MSPGVPPWPTHDQPLTTLSAPISETGFELSAPSHAVAAPQTVLQAGASPIAVAGTIGLLALFLSLTAHLAARNVLGDVAPIKALGVGLVPALVSMLTQLLSIPGVIGVALALALDGLAIHYLYGQPRRISAYLLAIHAIISIILGSVLIAGLILIASVPG